MAFFKIIPVFYLPPLVLLPNYLLVPGLSFVYTIVPIISCNFQYQTVSVFFTLYCHSEFKAHIPFPQMSVDQSPTSFLSCNFHFYTVSVVCTYHHSQLMYTRNIYHQTCIHHVGTCDLPHMDKYHLPIICLHRHIDPYPVLQLCHH